MGPWPSANGRARGVIPCEAPQDGVQGPRAEPRSLCGDGGDLDWKRRRDCQCGDGRCYTLQVLHAGATKRCLFGHGTHVQYGNIMATCVQYLDEFVTRCQSYSWVSMVHIISLHCPLAAMLCLGCSDSHRLDRLLGSAPGTNKPIAAKRVGKVFPSKATWHARFGPVHRTVLRLPPFAKESPQKLETQRPFVFIVFDFQGHRL